MQQTEKTRSLVLRIAAILLCLILVSLWMLGDYYARYTTQKDGSDEARVAIFGHDESITVPNSILEKLVPGSSGTYVIEINNGTGEDISEVSEKYTVEVVTAGNLPLEYTLKENGQSLDSFSESDAAKHCFSDSSMYFLASEAGAHTYTLEISWPEDRTDISLSGLPDYIQININVEQVD